MDGFLLTTEQKIQQYQRQINSNLNGFYTTGPKSLTETIQYVIDGGGKRVRPLLTMLAAEACGGNSKNALPAALSIELMHNFTLVHDDIMDRDNLRHGKETVHHKWNVSTAILTGDGMLSIALKHIQNSYNSNTEIPGIFIEGLLAVCEGQALDKEFEELEVVNEKNYLRMIDLKTGYLLGMSAEIGARTAGIDIDTSKQLMKYGRLIGRAFQIQDDLMEIYSDSSNMGKSLKSDIILGKKTYLMVLALEKYKSEIKQAVKIAESDFQSGIFKIRDLMNKSMIREQAQTKIQDTISKANNVLKSLNIDIDDLLYFSQLISNRGN